MNASKPNDVLQTQRKTNMLTKEVRCYTIKLQGEPDFIPGFMVLKVDGKFYNFERTIRSYESVYKEVKDHLGTLSFLSDEDLRSINIEDYFVRSFYL